MSSYHTAKMKFSILFIIVAFTGITVRSQDVQRPRPTWWFGESGAANFNFFRGTTQMLSNDLTVPTAFHKGKGVRPYASVLAEYRPGRVWGIMLNVAYDNRGGKFDNVMAPCNCEATLSTNVSYIAVEPSLRIAPFSNAFYIFAGPTLSFNIAKSFTYTQQKQSDTRGSWSDIHKTVFSGQAGAGVDIPISSRTSPTQMTLSPFASFQTDFGHEPRSEGSWSFYTIRTGIALKFGTSRKAVAPKPVSEPVAALAGADKDVQFSVRAPKVFPMNRKVTETFALRNSVFFDMGSSEIPGRYILLAPSAATTFKEETLQQGQPDDLNQGRSGRQLMVYHNILNILGDRMRSNPKSSIVLAGSSDKNPVEGRLMAQNIKNYLVSVFGIDASRISVEGRDKPVITSEQPGAVNDLALLREGDRRVDISSSSSDLLMQVGGVSTSMLRPVKIRALQEDPMDSKVLFNVGGADSSLKSWSVTLSDDQGNTQRYGPYTHDQAAISGKTILGANSQGNYKVIMTGETKTGKSISKESTVSLMKRSDPQQEGLRYSILFDFDRSKAIESYGNFLTDVVTPLIPDNATVIIHGHTDIIGDETYNISLSRERAKGAQQIIENALLRTGKKGVKFETYGFGEDPAMAPFKNGLPEERFYNRTVIVDIIPG